jgi:hypothetical protein
LSTASTKKQSPAGGRQLIAGAAVNFTFLAVLFLFACLREQSMFWTNVGNWPIWLRELVGASFYPLLLLELLLLMAFSGVCVRLLASRRPAGMTAVAVLPLLWTLFLLIVVIVGANNLDNLIAGQPLHWHRE